jgi:hypothetical protein
MEHCVAPGFMARKQTVNFVFLSRIAPKGARSPQFNHTRSRRQNRRFGPAVKSQEQEKENNL